MADNYIRQTQTFRSEDKSGVQFPVVVVGAHVRTYKGIESKTVSSTATAVALSSIPAGADFADIYCESQGGTATDFVRFWHGSTDPTSTVGIKLKDHEIIASADPATFSAILGSTSGTCTLRVEYYAYE